jgi:NADH-quinone oxidoreductase subunit L
MWFMDNAWLIPVVPAVMFFVILAIGKKMPMKGAELAILAMGTSLVCSVGTAFQWIQRVEDTTGSEGTLGSLKAFGQSMLPRAEGHESVPFVAPWVHSWTWWQSGSQEFRLGTMVDGLSVTLLVVVSMITLLVLIYSIEYMRDDIRFTYFFAALTLFAAGMLTMVSAVNTLQFLVGWELMGVCSFMLIGHWWEDAANSRAAMKAFLTVRTGDVGIILGIILMFFGANAFAQANFGTNGFDIPAIQAWALSGTGSTTLLLMASICLLWATIGKSGQFPLHTWLPDAMAGPTPVSSLLHSSTMVVAGVFLVARFYPVFWEGFHIGDGGVNPVALIGGITIIIAALLAFVQNDIKKVLAYSTVSQLGYMVMGLGVGAWTASVFHIFTHAWFKALLFLCAGSVSHSGSHHSFDMKTSMGGLRKKMPVTFTCWVIGTLALAGIFPLAGFWSKDEILANAGHNGYQSFMIVGLVGAFMTAAYMMRATYLTFFGEYRGAEHHADPSTFGHEFAGEDVDQVFAHAGAPAAHATHTVDAGHGTAVADDGHGAAHGGGHDDHGAHTPHESPKLITIPLIILAVFSITGGFLNAAAFNIEKFKDWVEPASAVVAVDHLVLRSEAAAGSVVPPSATAEAQATADERPADGQARLFPETGHAPFKWPLALLSLAIALSGFAVSFFVCRALYDREGKLVGLTRRSKVLGAGYTFLWNKYYLDAAYEKGVVPFFSTVTARASNWVNQNIIDAVVNTAGRSAVKAGDWVYENADQRVVDGIVNGAGRTAEGSGEALRSSQSGKVQQYGAYLFGAAAIGGIILVIVTSL